MDEDEFTEDSSVGVSRAEPRPSSRAADASTVKGDHYGRTVSSRRNGRLIASVFGGIVVLVIGSWVIWAGLDSSRASVDAQDKAHTILNSRAVEVVFDVSTDQGQTKTCAVEAQNEDHAIVGWKIVDVPASNQRTQEISTTVLTTEQAVTGLISGCWLT